MNLVPVICFQALEKKHNLFRLSIIVLLNKPMRSEAVKNRVK